jgi:hypothetical protein
VFLIFFRRLKKAKRLNTSKPSEDLSPMAAKAPTGGKKRKKKRKMRLSLKQAKMNTTSDKYSDSLGWSQDVGRTLSEAPAPKGPETLKVQCEMCGSMLKIPKPKRSKYTVTCSYPECGHQMNFD